MELLQRYETILGQGLVELGPFSSPPDDPTPQTALEVQAERAPDLGDILYRLTIEHGVPFTPFRETVISLISEPQEAVAAGARSKGGRRRFAADLEEAHPLILLALEMMPPDCPF
jgi:hypothetical protein